MHRRVPTWVTVVSAGVAGAVALAVGTWVVRWILFRLAAHEDALADAWYYVYLYVDYVVGAIVVLVALIAAAHNRVFGRKDARPHDRGDAVRWWSLLERAAHWVCVASFVVLLVSGVQLYFAGFGLPSNLTRAMRTVHQGDVFMVSGGLLFILWFRDALPRRYDLRWLAHLGGYLGYRGALPADRFNAGQKVWFWVASLAGLVMAVSGYELAYHFSRFDPGYLTLLALHLAAAAVFLSMLVVHVYMAVVAFRGTLGGMIHGRLGRQAAARFHSQAPMPAPVLARPHPRRQARRGGRR